MQGGGVEEARPSETLCALVLGGAPIVRAGITYMLKRHYAGRAHVFSAEWQATDRALASCGNRLDLIVLCPDGEVVREECLRLVNGADGPGTLVVVPPAGLELPLAARPDRVVLIPLGSPLPIWRKALLVAARRRSHLRSLTQPACGHIATAPLTERQHEVLDMLSMGLSNKVIASRLSLSVGTVKLHVSAVLRALKARNRLELVLSRAAMRAALARKGPESAASARAITP